jgi:4-hydroxybenzoyl-CoA thioesterase
MDASSLNFFVQCGVPPWRELQKTTGIIGTPLLEIHTKFMKPATYGERLQIHTSVTEWREKVLIHKHIVKRGDTVLCEGSETRAFCMRDPENPDRIKAIPIPADIKARCS